MYKLSLDFSASHSKPLSELVSPDSLEVRLTEDSHGNVQVGVPGLVQCVSPECSDYGLDNAKVEYEYLLSGKREYLTPLGQCRLEMDELSTLLDGEYEDSPSIHGNEVSTEKVIVSYKAKTENVSVWFSKIPEESVIMVTAVLKGVTRRGHDGLFRPIPEVAVPFHQTTHKKSSKSSN